MKTLSRKKQHQIITRYNNLWERLMQGDETVNITIHDAYKNPSYYNQRAWDDIMSDCALLDGLTPIILGHNCMTFSACFAYGDEKGRTHYRYYTAYNTYDFTE